MTTKVVLPPATKNRYDALLALPSQARSLEGIQRGKERGTFRGYAVNKVLELKRYVRN